MTRPASLPAWATGATYTVGPDAGTTLKIEPSSGEKVEGHVRGPTYAPSAQKENWLKNNIYQWLQFFSDEFPKVEVFAGPTSATWTKESWAKTVQVAVVGGGGGGGGAGNANDDVGGGGGGGGAVVWREFPATALGATAAIVAGTGGTAGVGTAGAGTTGGTSSFSTTGIALIAGGGAPGQGANLTGGGTGGAGGTGLNAIPGGAGGTTGANGSGGYGGTGGLVSGATGGGLAAAGYGGGGGGAWDDGTGIGAGGGGGGGFGGSGPTGSQYNGQAAGQTAGFGKPGAVIVISW